MFERFYLLNGMNDLSLKSVFLSFFLEKLHNDVDHLIRSTKCDTTEFGLGELSQIVLEALSLLCDKNAATERFLKPRKTLTKVCKTTFEIGCNKHELCDCKKKKPKSFRKRFEHLPRSSGRKQKIIFFKRKFQRQKRSDHCYLCKQKGHLPEMAPRCTSSQLRWHHNCLYNNKNPMLMLNPFILNKVSQIQILSFP
jgi:hypothetical protein